MIHRFNGGNGSRTRLVCFAILLSLVTYYLVLAHNVMGFSDPNHWIFRAIMLFEGEPQFRRVIVFPFYIGLVLRVVGTSWVSLANLPFILLAGGIGGLLASVSVSRSGLRNPHWASLAGALVFCAFFYFKADRWIVLINPYRDAGGIALVFVGWWLFLRSESRQEKSTAFLAGLVCALSVGFRESMLLSLLPLGVWCVASCFKAKRRWQVLGRIGLMAVGGLLGLSPFFYQNWRYSGYALVPSYSARNLVEHLPVDSEDEEGETVHAPLDFEREVRGEGPTRLNLRLERLVPGARPEYFRATFKVTRKRLFEPYRGWPMALLLAGLLFAMRRKDPFVLGVLLPSFLLTLLFYSFYRRYHWRYVVYLHTLLFILMGIGTMELLRCVCLGFRRDQQRFATLALVGLTTLFSAHMIRNVLSPPENHLKVWEIPVFRKALAEHLEEPREFLGFYHHREMLSWFVDEDFNHSSFGPHLPNDLLKREGLDSAMRATRANLYKKLAHQRLYFHGSPRKGSFLPQHTPPLIPLWADVVPVVDLKDLPVTLYRYGRPVNDVLYQVRPWTETGMEMVLPPTPLETPRTLLLMAPRLWDDPDRTFARMLVDGQPWVEQVGNGPGFYPLPPTEGPASPQTLRFESDTPLPSRLPFELWTLNKDLFLPFGMRSEVWFMDLLSEEIREDSGLRQDAFMLYHQGRVLLPRFADQQHRVYAELRLEFHREDPFFRTGDFTLSGDSTHSRSHRLPARRLQALHVFDLGPGSGGLDVHPLELSTSLPSSEEQLAMYRRRELNGRGFVKVFDIRIFALPLHRGGRFHMVAGERNSGAYLAGGFHLPERHQNRWPVRWTDGEGILELPSGFSDEPHEIVIRFFNPRPDIHAEHIQLLHEGSPLPATLTEVSPEDQLFSLRARLTGNALPSPKGMRLSLVSPGWVPREVLGVPDDRRLGLMLHEVVVTPIPTESPSP